MSTAGSTRHKAIGSTNHSIESSHVTPARKTSTAAHRPSAIVSVTTKNAKQNTKPSKSSKQPSLSYEHLTGQRWDDIKQSLDLTDNQSQLLFMNLFYHPKCGASPAPYYSASGSLLCSGCQYSIASASGSELLASHLQRSEFQPRTTTTFLHN